MASKYVLAIDQGTTSSRIAVLDESAQIIDLFFHDFEQILEGNKVLQDAEKVFLGVKKILDKAIDKYGKENIFSIGITNQRETTVVFDRSGKPIAKAISWQSKHTKEICDTWKALGYEPYVKKVTGLQINPYFSASKMAYFLQNENVQKQIEKDNALFGTMDTFILYKLSGGTSYYTDITNASRTMLFDIHKQRYDKKLLRLFGIKSNMLPPVKPNHFDFGTYNQIPIKAMIGDQQSALFGHLAFDKGMMKVTYGTGAFILMNTGTKVYTSQKGLISTVAYQLDKPVYALEGSIFIAGASINWLKDKLEIIKTSAESENYANMSLENIYFVPAFVGLGAPYWDTEVRGAIFGLTSNVKKCDIIKATLDAIAYQVKDVVDVMIKESSIPLEEVYVDGGVSNNDYLMQFQSDLLRCPLIKPNQSEITALGAGIIAGLNGLYDLKTLRGKKPVLKRYGPKMDFQLATQLYQGWEKAVESARTYK